MNYDQTIEQLIDTVKRDKSIVQPWRNYAVKHLMEAQAHVRMGKTTTNRELNFGADMQPSGQLEPVCTCPAGGLRRDCPVHGRAA